jgi:hypothetical protein
MTHGRGKTMRTTSEWLADGYRAFTFWEDCKGGRRLVRQWVRNNHVDGVVVLRTEVHP